MSLKNFYSREKTNSFRPTPWAWTEKPFPAFRGEGARHRGFLAARWEYRPDFQLPPTKTFLGFDPNPSKLTKSAKGAFLVTPCALHEDEQIMLVTLRGGFRGAYSRIIGVGAEILCCEESNMHCCPTAHLVIRLTHPNGFVYAETGRRSGTGLVEIFSWSGIVEMPTEEFEVWLTGAAPDVSNASLIAAKKEAEVERLDAVDYPNKVRREALEAERQKAVFLTELPTVVERLTALGVEHRLGETSLSARKGFYDETFGFNEEGLMKLRQFIVEKAAEKERKDMEELFRATAPPFVARLVALGVKAELAYGGVRLVVDGFWKVLFPETATGLKELKTYVEEQERRHTVPVEAKKIDLSGLFGGAAKVTKK